MKRLTGISALFLAGTVLATPALSADLRIGIMDDPDILDPAQSVTFAGRIVYTSLCDKLLDLDNKLAHRSAARHPMGLGRQWQHADHGSAPRRGFP